MCGRFQKHSSTPFAPSSLFVLLQAVIEAGCLSTLAEQLQDQRNVPEVVLSETSAAMAVLASHREFSVK